MYIYSNKEYKYLKLSQEMKLCDWWERGLIGSEMFMRGLK